MRTMEPCKGFGIGVRLRETDDVVEMRVAGGVREMSVRSENATACAV